MKQYEAPYRHIQSAEAIAAQIVEVKIQLVALADAVGRGDHIRAPLIAANVRSQAAKLEKSVSIHSSALKREGGFD